MIYEPVSLRSCQRCLTLLYNQGLLVRVQPSRGGLGGGSSGYVYGLSAKGADVLEAIDDAPRKQIPYVKDPETFTPERVWHQLDVNRCFIALWRALEAVDGHELVRWNSDPHLRMRYELAGRYGRSSIPTAWRKCAARSAMTGCSSRSTVAPTSCAATGPR